MKKLLLVILLFLFGCDIHYQANYQMNKRTPPIVIVAIDSVEKSVLMRDGNNKIFTIYDNPTTRAITHSRKVGDTLRFKTANYFSKKF